MSYTIIARVKPTGTWLKFKADFEADLWVYDKSQIIDSSADLLKKLGHDKLLLVAEELGDQVLKQHLPPRKKSAKAYKDEVLADALFNALLEVAIDPYGAFVSDVAPIKYVKLFNPSAERSPAEAIGSGYRFCFLIQGEKKTVIVDPMTLDQALVDNHYLNTEMKPVEQKGIQVDRIIDAIHKAADARKAMSRAGAQILKFLGCTSEELEAKSDVRPDPKKTKREATVYEILWDGKSDLKDLPRQARVCLEGLHRYKQQKYKLTVQAVEDCVKGLAAELKTKQDPVRVFKFYQSKLISLGLIRMKVES